MAAPGTPWIRLYAQLKNHPKVDDLCEALDIEKVQAIGHLVCLWCWVVEYFPDGYIGKTTPRKVARAAEWIGDAAAFVEALIQCKWLDLTEDGLEVHDWMDYAESYKRAQNKKATRGGGKNGNSDAPEQEKPESIDCPQTVVAMSPESPPERRGEERKREEKKAAAACVTSEVVESWADDDPLAEHAAAIAGPPLPPPQNPDGYTTGDLDPVAMRLGWRSRLSPKNIMRADKLCRAGPWSSTEMCWAVSRVCERNPDNPNIGLLLTFLEEARAGPGARGSPQEDPYALIREDLEVARRALDARYGQAGANH